MKTGLKLLVKNMLAATLLLAATQTFAQYDKYYYFNRGSESLRNGEYAHAINDFSILAQADTSLYQAFFFRGIAKYNLSDYIGALQDFNKSLSINPVFTQGYHYRAITFSQLGRFEDASKDYEKVVDLRPDHYGVYFSRGVTYLMSQKFDNAISDFNAYLKKEPNSGDAYVNRGTAFLMKHDTLNALDDYNKALYFSPFDPNAFIRRARIYAMQNHNDKALKDLNQAIKLDSTSSLVYFNRALVRYNMQDVNGALSDLDRVLILDPDNALSYYNRALIRSQIGDYNNALDDYGQVMMINPENVLVYYNRAAVEIELQDYRAAIRDYTRAIEIYPDFANAYMNRSYAKNQIGQYESARKDYNVAQQKIAQYRKNTTDSVFSIFADTSKTFNKLLALDADFTKKTFSNKLENRKIEFMILPQFKFADGVPKSTLPLDKQYFFPSMDSFLNETGIELLALSNWNVEMDISRADSLDAIADTLMRSHDRQRSALGYFIKGISQGQQKQFSSAINYYNRAIELDPRNIFYYLNRSVSRSEMIEFISNIESSIPKLSQDEELVTTKNPTISHTYDYREALADLDKLENLNPSFAYLHYNRGNLLCLSNRMPEAIDAYTRAISSYAYFGEAYFNRGLISIYLRDTEKGCIDVSKSGELGVSNAYAIIRKYCLNEE
jgi:tetratricopeptide (TPR) repeat protein